MKSLQDVAERDKKAYKLALQFLVNTSEKITPEIIELHVSESEFNRPNGLSTIFRRLIDSARNAQMKRNVIGNLDDLQEALCDYDPFKVLQRYHGNSGELLAYIVDKTKAKDRIRLTSRSIWPQYCGSIISAASFLINFSDAREFHKFVSFFHQNDMAIPALPMLISKEVHGFGFALACDFLKEIGYQNYAKPDVHLKRILSSLNLCDSNDDYSVFKAVIRIAKNVDDTPYAVDKIFWLIGSGYFYRSDIGHTGRHGPEFIEWAKPQLNRESNV